MFNIVSSDEVHFEMLNFPFLDGDVPGVPLTPSYGVYILQLIRFERVCSNVYDFNKRTSILTTF